MAWTNPTSSSSNTKTNQLITSDNNKRHLIEFCIKRTKRETAKKIGFHWAVQCLNHQSYPTIAFYDAFVSHFMYETDGWTLFTQMLRFLYDEKFVCLTSTYIRIVHCGLFFFFVSKPYNSLGGHYLHTGEQNDKMHMYSGDERQFECLVIRLQVIFIYRE